MRRFGQSPSVSSCRRGCFTVARPLRPMRRNSWYGIVDDRWEGERFPMNREQAATHRAAQKSEVNA